MSENAISFKTLRQHKAVIIKQPFTVTKKDNKGKVIGRRQVQYVSHLSSIFVDEQIKIDPTARPTSIRINNGIITVQPDNPQLIETLQAYPGNVANGGNLFKELDVANEELYELEKYEAVDKARRFIMESDENALRAAAVFFLNPNYMNKTHSTLKLKLRNAVDSIAEKPTDPTNFIANINGFFSEKDNDEKLTAIIAIHEGIIKIVNGKKMAWADSEETIYIAAQQKDVIQDFAVWMKSDKEGRQVLSVLADKITALKAPKKTTKK